MSSNPESLHEEPQPSSIFEGMDALEREEHEKGIRRARNTLFFVGGLMFVVDMIILALQRDVLTDTDIYVALGIDALLLAAFVALGLWSRRKPYSALLAGLILFVLLQVVNIINDPANLARGIVVKVLVIGSLVSGIKKAKRLQELNRIIGAG